MAKINLLICFPKSIPHQTQILAKNPYNVFIKIYLELKKQPEPTRISQISQKSPMCTKNAQKSIFMRKPLKTVQKIKIVLGI